jgi:hypothetical protein
MKLRLRQAAVERFERERILTLAMRAALPERPDPAAEAALVRRLAETARIAQEEAGDAAQRAAPARRSAPGRDPRTSRPPFSRRRLALRLAVAVGAFVFATAGLAVAGVKLPQPARTALDDIGVHLPNQSAVDDEGISVGDPAEVTPPVVPAVQDEPPARGKSKAAHQRVREARARRLAEGHGKKLGYTRGKAIGLNEATPPGQLQRQSAPQPPSPSPHSSPGGSAGGAHGSAGRGRSRSSHHRSSGHGGGHGHGHGR